MRDQRLPARRKSIRPTGRGSIQEKHVCPARKTGLRRRDKGYKGKTVG